MKLKVQVNKTENMRSYQAGYRAAMRAAVYKCREQIESVKVVEYGRGYIDGHEDGMNQNTTRPRTIIWSVVGGMVLVVASYALGSGGL